MINKQEKGADGADLFLLTQYYLEWGESVDNKGYVKKDRWNDQVNRRKCRLYLDTFLWTPI